MHKFPCQSRNKTTTNCHNSQHNTTHQPNNSLETALKKLKRKKIPNFVFMTNYSVPFFQQLPFFNSLFLLLYICCNCNTLVKKKIGWWHYKVCNDCSDLQGTRSLPVALNNLQSTRYNRSNSKKLLIFIIFIISQVSNLSPLRPNMLCGIVPCWLAVD